MNKVIKCAGAGLCGMILVLGNIQRASAETFINCNSYVNIHKDAYLQSLIVGYIYKDNIIQNIQQEKEGWIKIVSGDVNGWIDKKFIIEDNSKTKGYTVAKIHPQSLSVYIEPNKESIVYTTVYKNQEIECVEYKNDWLTLAFEDGSYGFIDAYQAELKTYYGKAKPIENNINIQEDKLQLEENFNQQQTYDIIYQSDNIEDYNYEYNELNQQQQYKEDSYNYNNEEQYSQYNENNYEALSYQYNENIEDNYIYEEQYQQSYDYEDDYGEQSYDYEDDYDYEEQSYEDNYNYEEQLYEDDYEEQLYQQQNNQNYEEYNENNSDIVNYADQFIGNPYVYGGNSLTDGIDCSHFVYQVLTNTGHYSGGYATSDGWAGLGESVSSLDEAQAGDVIVYPGHVAIYDGNGGIVEAKGSQWGITHDREADHGTILAIRHFD